MRFTTLLINNLARRKARSLLTCGGVAVAVGTTVALLGIAQGFEDSSIEVFGDRGVEIIVVQEGVLDQLSSDLDESLGGRIRQVEGVRDVAPGLVELIDYSASGTVLSVLVNGWEPGSLLFDELELLEGRHYTAADEAVVMIGETLAKNLDKQVGDTMTIQREAFTIVGIYRSFNLFENGAIAAPLSKLQDVMSRHGSVTGFSVTVDRGGAATVDVEAVCRRINDLQDEDGASLGLAAMPTKEYVTNSMHIRMAHSMAWLTSAIALFVGCIGMLNTMLMSVVERIREISILRAIGWKKSRVVRMILGECLLLSMTGAVGGILCAMVFTSWLTTLPAVSGFIDGRIAPIVVAEGLLIAICVGFLGGVYPAYRAARLQPCEGLAHE